MIEAAKRYPDIDLRPMGNFGVHVPRAVRPIAEWSPNQHLLLRMEQRLVRRSEDRVARSFETTMLGNAQEAALLRERARVDGDRVQVVPPLLGNRPQPGRDYRGVPEYVFLGQLSLTHNDVGLRYFLTDIWPLVLAQRPDARLVVVGRDAPPGLVALAAQFADSVTLEGYVPELAGILSRSVAMVNPLRFGSGVKLKIIEALCAGLPVVSTSVGADGVSTGVEHGVVVGDSAAEFARQMLEAADTVCNAELSAGARQHFANTFSRAAVFARYDAVFGLG
jgi:glycosyltransferase involved in cell wall biosynthesis